MIKIYEIRGVVECSRVFRLGELCVRCGFSGGAVNETGVIPAVYSTSNPVIQTVIENSELYKGGRIKIQSQIPEDSDNEKEDKEEGVGGENDCTDFPDVKNSQMAKDVLMSEPYNISLSELANKASVQAKAKELNITFSNWD